MTVTIQEYQRLGMKLAGAERELGDDYPEFERLLKQMAAAKVEYANEHGQIDYSALAPETRTRLKQLLADIQPYFDRLNHAPVLRDLLTPEEYDAFIEAQLLQETILAKAGANPSVDPVRTEDLPEELRADYEQAERTIRSLEEKAAQTVKNRN